MAPSSTVAGYGLGLVGVVIFGLTLPATRIAVREIDPLAVTAGRALLAGLAALMVLLVLRRPPPWRHLPQFFVIGLLLIAGFPGFTALAMRTVPAAHGGVVLALLPLATAMAAVLVAGERPSPRFWAFAVLGAGIVLAYAARNAGGTPAAGDLWLVAAVASAALGYALSGRLSRHLPGWEVISWTLVVWLPPTVAVLFAAGMPPLPALSHDVLAAFVYLGLFSQFLGFFAWNAGLALGGVARVGQVQLLQTFITLLAAALLVGETLDATTVAAAAAVVLVVALGRHAPVARNAD